MRKALEESFIISQMDKHSSRGGIRRNTVKVVFVLLVTSAIAELMYSFNLGNQNIAMLYLLAVLVISAFTPNYAYGVASALVGTLAYDFMITAPRLGFSFTTGLPITLIIMLAVTIVSSAITARIKERAYISFRREQRAQLLFEINQKLLAARSLDSIVALTGEYVSSHLRRPAILYEKDPSADGLEAPEGTDGQTLLLYTPEQLRRVHRMFRIGESETERPFDDSGYDVYNAPVSSNGKVLGVIGIACGGDSICENDLPFIRILSGQVALALELQFLSDKQSRIVVEAEKEKMRGILLRSISHDLRTPLTGILGASSTILEQNNLDAKTLEGLVNDIKLDAQWLIRLVENILIITRLSGDNIKVNKEMEAAEEVISEAVTIVRKRYPGYTFHVHVPDELLLVPMDGTLISQVLINLLENAAKNSPDGSLLLVDLREKDGFAEFDVIDNGSGIPENLLDSLFEVHATVGTHSIDASRGVGLGLSICKTIVQAHGGAIEGCNREKQGSRFSFRLPLRETDETDEE